MNAKALELMKDYGELTQEKGYPLNDAKFAQFLSLIGYKVNAQAQDLAA